MAAAPALAALPAAAANNDIYIGPSGNWSDGTNWSLGVPPQTGDAAMLTVSVGNAVAVSFDAGAANPSTLTIDAPVGASLGLVQGQGSLVIGGNEIIGASAGGSVTLAAGTQSIGDNLLMGDGSTTAAGAFTMSGGALAITNFSYVGNRGFGRFTQSGGSQSIGQRLTLGHFKGAAGIFTLSDGASLVVARGEVIGEAGVGIFNQTGGVHIIGSPPTTLANLTVAANSGAVGTFNLSGGTLTVRGNETIGGSQANGAFQQNGGSHSISGTLMTVGLGGTGVVNLNGGTLSASTILNGGVFTYGGGTLSVIKSITNSGTMILSGPGTRLINAASFSNGERGRINVVSTTARFTEPFTNQNAYISQASDNYFTDVIVGPGGEGGVVTNGGAFQAGSGDRFFISGGYTSTLTIPLQPLSAARTFNVGAAEVHFTGGGVHAYRALPSAQTFPLMIIDAGNTLNLSAGSFAPALADRGVVTITANGSAAVSALSGTGTATVGSGTIAATLRVDSLQLTSAVINGLGTLRLGSGTAVATTTASLSSLTLNTGAKLDVNEKLTLNYGTNASPLSFVRQRIGLASAGGLWIGSGITSTFAASNRPRYGLADTDGADGLISGVGKGQVLVRPALWGDVNFDGKVNAADINQIVARGHLNDLTGNHNWIDGDMDYDGVITSSDLRQIALSGNYSGPPAPSPATADAQPAVTGTPTYTYNPASGDMTFLTNGVADIVDLHLVSISQKFIPAHSTFTGLATKTAGELESTLFGSTFPNGFDLGTVLPPGLSLAALSNDLVLRYSVNGGGSEQIAALVPEPGMLGGLVALGWFAKRRRRVSSTPSERSGRLNKAPARG